ncbi:hypothetical protein F0267_01975 [Vibrio coralliilyticus]|uniref:Uncharacterized protein n=2 Tax=Vibrio TaxID=662 RepID=A0AAN0W0W5_9VIBR|nr:MULTISPECIES: hypothetical protein [Vibrio]AIW22433.1 hypothetical protein IX92_25540 [Vibrio coralliilyticus]MCZ2799092.1 hypothetical protein [Vibrio alginolyticus]NOH36993.1 hypothetical protein [Vibrio coralliilyticus]PAW02509.1 hypothetical protein CKJ79_17745 [Vibrio coralliilyticus]POB47250.1 hypothetical protein CRN52_14310 [Vibrio vulnificus]
MKIVDLYGNQIEVTDLEAAIDQAKGGSKVNDIYQTPFSIDSQGVSTPISGKENERHSVGEYWSDALKKLRALQVA